ncbi:MAG: Ppx/GppA phosphatase family protein [Actinomycetota bacterium]
MGRRLSCGPPSTTGEAPGEVLGENHHNAHHHPIPETPLLSVSSRARVSASEAATASQADMLAAIDIGTNSVHLVVARVTGPQAMDVVEREREMIRLGSGGGDMKYLDPAAVDRAIVVLARFRAVAEVHGASVVAVATSAVREAENRSAFLERARAEAGVEVEIISGVEEARLIQLGVLQAVPVFDQRLLLCDIGGGSTELLLGHRGDMIAARSMKLGSSRLTQRFFAGTRISPTAVDSCRRHVRAIITPFARDVRRSGFEVAVGSSGSIGAICAMAVARRGELAPRTWNSFQLSRADLDGVVKALLKDPSVPSRAKLAGLDPRRADIVLAGALILEQVYEVFGITSMLFSDYALREGVLLYAWQRRHGGSLHHLSELRRSGVMRLAEVMDEDREHSAHVARLALELFDQTSLLHGLNDDAREYLEAAALLCNIGLFVSHAGHHRHSYYLIRNSEALTGFTDREIELVAQIARYHRKGSPRPTHPEFAGLTKADQALVRCCAALLRIAIGLDRTHAARVSGVTVRLREGVLQVLAEAREGADVGLDLFSAAQRADLLAEVLAVKVDVVGAS